MFSAYHTINATVATSARYFRNEISATDDNRMLHLLLFYARGARYLFSTCRIHFSYSRAGSIAPCSAIDTVKTTPSTRRVSRRCSARIDASPVNNSNCGFAKGFRRGFGFRPRIPSIMRFPNRSPSS